jgi:membrane dipeptidase
MLKSTVIIIILVLLGHTSTAQRHRQLHFSSVVVDTHNDVLSTASINGMNMAGNLRGKTHSDMARFAEGGVDVQIFSIFCDERQTDPFRFALREIDSLDAVVARCPNMAVLAGNVRQLRQAVKQQKLACMKGVEGGHMIENDLGKLDSLYQRGVRYLTITWNNSTPWATSAKDETDPIWQRPKGLSDFGKQVIQRMNQLGMLVDLSHVGEQTFWDAMAITSRPVLVSHSSVYALCPHRRNLKDEQIKAVAKNGGVIHVNFYSGFIDSNYERRKAQFMQRHQEQVDSLQVAKKVDYEIDEWLSQRYPAEAAALRPSLDMLINHIDYIVRLVGADHVGLGSDFDGIESLPLGLEGVQDMPTITEALLQRGYSKKDIRKILGGNFLRVLAANEGR